MNFAEIIRRRRSVRTFDGEALRPDDAKKILDFAVKAENPYEIPITWYLPDAARDNVRAPVIVGAQTYIAGKIARVPHAEEAFGYSFEEVVLYAHSLGVGTTWIAGTMDRPAFERAVALASGEVMPCVSPLGYPAKKMSLRETVMRKGVKADSRNAFETLFFDGSFGKPLAPEAAGALRTPLEAVRLSPSAVNKQPWRVVLRDGAAHFYEKRNRGFTKDDGWDLQKIDMGIAMCHFALTAAEAGTELSFQIRDPEIPTPDDTVYIASYRVGHAAT